MLKKITKIKLNKIKKFNFLSCRSVKMENIKIRDLYLSKEESTNIIEILTKMRNIKNYINIKKQIER